MKQYSDDKPLSVILYFLVLFFYTTVLVLSQRNHFYIVPTLLFLLSVPYLFGFIRVKDAVPVSAGAVVYAMLAYVAVECFMVWYHQDPTGGLKPAAAVLLSIPVIFLVARAQIRLDRVWLIFALAAVVIGVVSVYDRFYLHLPRALIGRQPIIPAGGVAMSLGMFCLYGMFVRWSRKQNGLAALYLLAALSAVLCSILTGSRGTWLCLPVVVLVLVWFYLRRVKHVWIAPVLLAVLLSVIAWMPQSGMMQRVEQVDSDLTAYFEGENRDTSLGLRLQFWRSALDGFVEKPLLGWGSGEGYQIMKQKQQQKGLITVGALSHDGVTFTHAHNQFLDTLVKKGILGLAVLLGVVFAPLIYFIRLGQKATTSTRRSIAGLGVIHVFCAVSYCLSDVFFGLKIGMVFYCMTLAVLVGMGCSVQTTDKRYG